MKEFTENIEGIGDVSFIRSKKAGRINIKIKQDGKVQVAVPMHALIDDAINFVVSKKLWIEKSKNRIAKKNSDSLIFPEKPIITHFHTINFMGVETNKVSARIDDGIVTIQYPQNFDNNDKQLQDAFRYVLAEVLRKEAKSFLPGRVQELADKYNFEYNDLRIKNIKSRWGSCSGRNNINLSLHVMLLPKNLIDHIILHELCHTIEKNHGPRFHKLLEKVRPDAREESKEIKEYKIFIS